MHNMAVVTLPSGFKFLPTNLELVRDYLLNKLTNQPLPSDDSVIEYDVYSTEPWNLPGNSIYNSARKIRKHSYCFVRRQKNDDDLTSCDGNRVKHIVKCGDGTSNRIVGYWKKTKLAPKAKLVCNERKKIVGIMKAFAFHYYTTNNSNADNNNKNDNEECRSIKTNWIMREYMINSQRFQPWVLCSVINKSHPEFRQEYDHIKRIVWPPIDPVEAEREEEACYPFAIWAEQLRWNVGENNVNH